jgi:hypothetical protein
MQELLPVKYYHVVFTLPHELGSTVLGNRGRCSSCSLMPLLPHCSLLQGIGATSGLYPASSVCFIHGDSN